MHGARVGTGTSMVWPKTTDNSTSEEIVCPIFHIYMYVHMYMCAYLIHICAYSLFAFFVDFVIFLSRSCHCIMWTTSLCVYLDPSYMCNLVSHDVYVCVQRLSITCVHVQCT